MFPRGKSQLLCLGRTSIIIIYLIFINFIKLKFDIFISNDSYIQNPLKPKNNFIVKLCQ